MSLSGYSQTVFTQTFVDRCTGDVKIVTANFVNGSATVAFYDKVKIFTYQQFLNGELQTWLQQTYAWWSALSPCSTTTTQAQQAQQTAQQAQQAAQTAASAASSVVIPPVTPPTPPSTPPPTTPPPSTGGGTTNTTNTTSGGNTSGGTTSSSSSSSSGGSSEGSSSGGSSETKTETKTEETKTETKTEETKTEETKTEETKEETKTEESKEETKEESKEESSEEESSEEESSEESEEESKEEKKEEKKKEKEEKKKQRTLAPIQLKADMMAMQNPLGGYNAAMNFGASQSSVFGDVSYGVNLMVFDNLKQATLGLNKSKIYMDESYNVDWIESLGVNYGNNFGTQSIGANFMRLKPMGKYGTAGVGVNYTYMFDGLIEKPMGSMGYNLLYTNSIIMNEGRLTYSPAFIVSQTPISFTVDSESEIKQYQVEGEILLPSTVSKDAMFILANSFTYRLTKRFTFNFGYTAIKSTNPLIPLISSFMIGSKLPF
jgi:type II secretory pathway pseudopilin PulG